MTLLIDDQHNDRMKALVEYTSSSLKTEFPSPFGAAIYDSESRTLLSQAYDTVMQKCDHARRIRELELPPHR